MNDNTLCVLFALWLGLTLHHHGYEFVGGAAMFSMLWDLLFPVQVLDERSVEPVITAIVCTVITCQFDHPITCFMCWIALAIRTIRFKPEPPGVAHNSTPQ